MGGNDIGEEAEEAIMKAQIRRPLLDIAYRIGGNDLRRNGRSEPSTATIPDGQTTL